MTNKEDLVYLGRRIVLDLDAHYAELFSATPFKRWTLSEIKKLSENINKIIFDIENDEIDNHQYYRLELLVERGKEMLVKLEGIL